MLKLMTAASVLLVSVAAAAAATQQCLRPAEAEAEQAIRFQTELMVVSDTCRDETYLRFSRRNRKALADYQKRMIEHYRRSGAAHPKARLDSYMTQLANEASLRAGETRPEILCRDKAELLATAESLEGKTFRRYVAEQAAQSGAADRRCRR
ncbi:MAG TPA: hypothetical protein VF502_02590 [Stellaceae bacterium]